MKLLRKLKRKAIFFFGDIRRENTPLGFALGHYPHAITYDESDIALTCADIGYIGLHRNAGDLSNLAIKGFMKHAWIHVDSKHIVEAVSEGVRYCHAYHALMSDYVIILKPLLSRGTTKKARLEAVKRAFRLEGVMYDDTFTFDLEREEKIFQDKETALRNIRQYGLGVSCTEAVALCYVGQRRKLGIYRTEMAGKQVIMPDSFITTHFKIVYASPLCTPENADKMGLHEEGVRMLEEYWRAKC